MLFPSTLDSYLTNKSTKLMLGLIEVTPVPKPSLFKQGVGGTSKLPAGDRPGVPRTLSELSLAFLALGVVKEVSVGILELSWT